MSKRINIFKKFCFKHWEFGVRTVLYGKMCEKCYEEYKQSLKD